MGKSLSDALALMRQALAILDESGAPPEIGADLDLAIARLEGRFGGVAIQSPTSTNLDGFLSEGPF
jgi:hypothetical protein